MAIRLQEIHPSLAHFPLTLVPLSVTFDLVGRITGNRTAMQAGRWLMPIGAVSALITGVAGLIAQEATRPQGRAEELLVTHRNLNAGLIALTTAMAASRARHERPGWFYLTLGLVGTAMMSFTAYIGGKMVYEHGVGVRPAGGVTDAEAPEVKRETWNEAGRLSAQYAMMGMRHVAEKLAAGKIAPTLRA